MQKSRPSLGQRLRNNWLELLMLAILAVALTWVALMARGVWQTVAAVPEPTATPTLTPAPTFTPAPSQVAAATPVLRNTFDGQLAAGHVADLVAAGPRTVGSDGHTAAVGQLIGQLRQAAWGLQQQSFTVGDVPQTNIVARSGSGDVIVIAAHYDSSPVSDLDADGASQATPSPGANDGASGPAILLELARALDKDKLSNEVWLAFLDGRYLPAAEDSGLIGNSGAQTLAQTLPENVKAVILVDLAGAEDQRFPIYSDGDQQLTADLWRVAEQLGYARWFVPDTAENPETGLAAFSGTGIPAAAIIGPDYPWLRTTGDTPDKVSAGSLERVGRVLEAYFEGQQ